MLCSIVGGQSLISKLESEESKISEAEAKEFSSGEATQADEEPEEEEDSEDLVSIFININISKRFSGLKPSNFGYPDFVLFPLPISCLKEHDKRQ